MDNYNEIIAKTKIIALATSVDGQPNVRMVNYVVKEGAPNVFYFATYKGSPKTAEIAKNPKVGLMTLGLNLEGKEVRSHNAVCRPSATPLAEMVPAFIAKDPGFEAMLKSDADKMDLFEIVIAGASVITDFMNVEEVSFA